MEQETVKKEEVLISWTGSFAQNYEDVFGPFLIMPYATDLVGRISKTGVGKVLELACGTGRVTELLVNHFPETVQITATDLNMDMMDIAQAKINVQNISWEIVDMMAIPFQEEEFDLVVCQFGVMFAHDKLKSFTEMYRVLKKGGTLLFNTWGNITERNTVWNIFSTVLEKYLPNMPPLSKNPNGPFGMQDEKAVIELLKNANFSRSNVVSVIKEGETDSAANAVRGFLLGTPTENLIRQKSPTLLEEVFQALEIELIRQLGNHPLKSPLQAWVFEAIK